MKRKLLNLLFVVSAVVITVSCSDDEDSANVSLHANAITLFPGQDSLVSATVTGNKSITWSSDKTNIATVDANGNIVAVAPGVANITAKAKGGKTATAVVTVVNGYSYGGEVRESKTAIFRNYQTESSSEGMRFYFMPTVEEVPGWGGANEILHIDIPTELLGEKFELTEEDLYDWGWWIRYSNHDEEFYLEGFGSEEAMEDVVGGFMYAKQTGEDTFEVQIELEFTNGKKLVLGHKGAMTAFEGDEFDGEGGRRATRN